MKRIWKILSLMLAVLVLAVCFAGCTETAKPSPEVTATEEPAAEPEASPEPTEEPVVNRIVCMTPSMVEVVYALGKQDEIVGWSAYTDYPPEVEDTEGWESYHRYEGMMTLDEMDVDYELAKQVPVVSRFYDYNAELVDAVEPTIILLESSAQAGMQAELEAKGYTVIYSNPTTLDEVFEMMLTIGEALGASDVAEELVAGYRADIAEIEAITADLPKVKVYFEIAHQMDYGEYGIFGPYTNASGTPFDDMIRIAGGENLFGDLEGDYVQVAFADVVERNPDIILSPMWPNAQSWEVTTLYEIYTREGFDATNAVLNSRVHFYDSSLMKRFGPRTVTAIKKLAYLLHPYYFENPENSVSPWELGKIDAFYAIPESLH